MLSSIKTLFFSRMRRTKKRSFCRNKRSHRTRRNKRSHHTRRNKRSHHNKRRHHIKGGDYGKSVTSSTYDSVPILNEDSDDLSVTIPGFGVMGMKEFKRYMEDRDRNGSSQM